MILEELAAVLGYRIEGEQNLTKFNEGLTRARRNVGTMAAGVTVAARQVALGMAAITGAVTAATLGITRLADSAARPLDELVKSADRVGVTVEALQELGFAAEQSGASIGELSSGVEMIGRRLAEAARGQGRAKQALEDYGLSATDSAGRIKQADEFLLELSGRFQSLEREQALDLASKLGISPGLVTMLRSGADEIERLRQQARDAGLIFTDDDARAAVEYNDAMNLLRRTTQALRFSIGIDLLPVLTEMVSSAQRWFQINRELIRQDLGGFVRRMALNIRTLSEVLARLDLSPIWVLAAGLGLLIARLSPVLRLMLLFAFALDDVLTYMRDGESVIGDFIGWLRDLTGVSETTAQAIAGVAAALAAWAVLSPRRVLGLIVRGLSLLGVAAAAAAGSLVSGFIAGRASAGLGATVAAAFAGALAFLATPVGLGLLLAGVAAAVVAYFWRDLRDAWDAIDWEGLADGFARFGDAAMEFLRDIADRITGFVERNIAAPIRDAIGRVTGFGERIGGGIADRASDARSWIESVPSRLLGSGAGGGITNNEININQSFGNGEGRMSRPESMREEVRRGTIEGLRNLGVNGAVPVAP